MVLAFSLIHLSVHAQNLTMGPAIRFAPDTSIADLFVADLDSDGKAEIIATSPSLHALLVFQNTSTPGKIDTGAFAKPLIFQTENTINIVAIEDMDLDGKPDIIVINRGYSDTINGKNALTIFHNESNPGKLKLSAIQVKNDSKTQPFFNCFPLLIGDNMVQVSDFNGDGMPDITVLNTEGFISIYTNTYTKGSALKTIFGAPVHFLLSQNPTSILVGDMNDDGSPDIVTSNPDSTFISVLVNYSKKESLTPVFQRIDFKLDFKPNSVSIADVNNDGKPDVLLSRQGSEIPVIIYNTSISGNFKSFIIQPDNLHIYSNYNNNIVMQDMNGDGKDDIISLNAGLNQVELFTRRFNDAHITPGVFNKKVNYKIEAIPDYTGDLDGDGVADIIIGSLFGLDIYRGKSLIKPSNISYALKEYDLNIYPNPAINYTNIKYALSEPSDMVISVITENGKTVQSFKTGERSAGTHIQTLKTLGLKPGLYIITLQGNNYKKDGKLVVE